MIQRIAPCAIHRSMRAGCPRGLSLSSRAVFCLWLGLQASGCATPKSSSVHQAPAGAAEDLRLVATFILQAHLRPFRYETADQLADRRDRLASSLAVSAKADDLTLGLALRELLAPLRAAHVALALRRYRASSRRRSHYSRASCLYPYGCSVEVCSSTPLSTGFRLARASSP